MDIGSIIPLVISVIAVCFSVFSWWYLWRTPFKLRFTAGRPILSTVVDQRSSGLLITAPIVPIDLANIGARGGIVEDIRIVVRTSKANRKWILYPEYFCEEFVNLGTLFEKGQTEKFHPLFIRSRESTFKNIWFRPVLKYDQLQPLSFSNKSEPGVLPDADIWTFEYYVLDNSSPEYRVIQEHNFQVTKAQILGGTDIPETIEMIDAQNKLMNRLM